MCVIVCVCVWLRVANHRNVEIWKFANTPLIISCALRSKLREDIQSSNATWPLLFCFSVECFEWPQSQRSNMSLKFALLKQEHVPRSSPNKVEFAINHVMIHRWFERCLGKRGSHDESTIVSRSTDRFLWKPKLDYIAAISVAENGLTHSTISETDISKVISPKAISKAGWERENKMKGDRTKVTRFHNPEDDAWNAGLVTDRK